MAITTMIPDTGTRYINWRDRFSRSDQIYHQLFVSSVCDFISLVFNYLSLGCIVALIGT
jgi:hypothetical protein